MTGRILKFSARQTPVTETYEDPQNGLLRTRISVPGTDGQVVLKCYPETKISVVTYHGEISSKMLESSASTLATMQDDMFAYESLLDHSEQAKPVSIMAILNTSLRWNHQIMERDAGRKNVVIQCGNFHLRRYIQSLYAHKSILFASDVREATRMFSEPHTQTILNAYHGPRGHWNETARSSS